MRAAKSAACGAELERLVEPEMRRQPQRRARASSAARIAVGLDVEVVRVGVVEGGADVLPVVAQRRLDVLLGGDDHARALGGQQVEQLAEVVDRQQLGDVGALVGVLERGDLGQLAVLGRELGGGRDLDGVGVARASAA